MSQISHLKIISLLINVQILDDGWNWLVLQLRCGHVLQDWWSERLPVFPWKIPSYQTYSCVSKTPSLLNTKHRRVHNCFYHFGNILGSLHQSRYPFLRWHTRASKRQMQFWIWQPFWILNDKCNILYSQSC